MPGLHALCYCLCSNPSVSGITQVIDRLKPVTTNCSLVSQRSSFTNDLSEYNLARLRPGEVFTRQSSTVVEVAFTGCSLFKVTESDIGWLSIYDFLLVIQSNCGPISYHFWNKQQFQLKTQIFLTLQLTNYQEWYPWNFVTALALKTTLWQPYQMAKKFCDKYNHFDAIPAWNRWMHRRVDALDGQKSRINISMLMHNEHAFRARRI